jgi:hypothetical protein
VSKLAFVLVSDSTATVGGAKLTTAVLQMIADAVNLQCGLDVCPEWGGTCTVRVASSTTDVQPGEIACWIKDSLSETPGAAAYHTTLSNGAAVAYFALEDNDSFTKGVSALSVDVSHEILETIADTEANLWADLGNGTERALEICDPVQNTFYQVPNGVDVTNFLLKSAFAPGAPGPWDKMGLLPNQSDYSHGYEIVRDVGQALQVDEPSQEESLKERLQPNIERWRTLWSRGTRILGKPTARALRKTSRAVSRFRS